MLQRLIEIGATAGHPHVLPELLTDLRDPLQSALETDLTARHAALIPHQLADFSMEISNRPCAVDRQQSRRPLRRLLFRCAKSRVRWIHRVQTAARDVVA